MMKAMWKVYKEYEPELQQMLEEIRVKKKIYILRKERCK